jgi:hypothetical protein
MTYRVPAGWHVAAHSLTPHLVDPHELFTTGTGRLDAGPGLCTHMPSAALAAMSTDDVLITVQERAGSDGGFPPRPRHFALNGAPRSEADQCAGRNPAFVSHWFEFRDRGRLFHVLVAVGRSAPDARIREAVAILDSLRIRQAQPGARFPARPGWHTRVSPLHREHCLRQRTSWASTVAFADKPFDLPPHAMIAVLPPGGIIMAVMHWTECRRLRGVPTLEPPLRLDQAVRMQFPGPRGDELPLYRITGRFAGRYNVDLWVFFGRRHPTTAQRAAAQRELSDVRWPASP